MHTVKGILAMTPLTLVVMCLILGLQPHEALGQLLNWVVS